MAEIILCSYCGEKCGKKYCRTCGTKAGREAVLAENIEVLKQLREKGYCKSEVLLLKP